MDEHKIHHYSTDEEGKALLRPDGTPVYFCGEPEDNSFFRDHRAAWLELDMLLEALNKYGWHTVWCNIVAISPKIVGADYVCNCDWDKFEKKFLINK